MSEPPQKVALVRRSVVELDLIDYSRIARLLEQHTDAAAILPLNDQIQGFIDSGLKEAGCTREDVVKGTAGDNALLAFERASEAHKFSEAVHRVTAKHNTTRTDPTAHRYFRIGISTGKIAIRGEDISGERIIDSVRLEAAGKKGHILIDEATFEELSAKLQPCYRDTESISDKQNKSYRVRRFVVFEDVGLTPPMPVAANFDPKNKVFYVPFRSKGDQVIGIEKVLEDVRKQLTTGLRTNIGQTAAFEGLGGLGKTQLAVEYAYRFKDEYPNGVIWLAGDQDLDAQLIDLSMQAKWIAKESEHKYKLEIAKQRLRTYSDCLIIFDNLVDLKVIESYLPEPAAIPHILVTSRTDILDLLTWSGSAPMGKSLLCALLNLGTIWSELRDNRKALEFRQKALEIQKQIFGELDKKTASHMFSIGRTLIAMNRRYDAYKITEEYLNKLPKDHPYFLRFVELEKFLLSKPLRPGFRNPHPKRRI